MKNLIITTVAMTTGIFSCAALADKIIIKGQPISLEQRENVYYVPSSFQPTTDYYYITTNGTQRICYKEKQSNINLEPSQLDVNIGGQRTTWTCYNYDTTYFDVQ